MSYSTGNEDGEGRDSSSDEYTSLLPRPIEVDNTVIWDDRENPKDDVEFTTSKLVLRECLKLMKDSIPVILAYTLQMSLQTVTVIIVGHSSPMNLAASAFSLMFALVTGWMIALGGTTALDTLASSTFTGSENKHDLGILLQRAFLVLGLLYIPVAVIWACSNPIFQALGQDPELSYQSSRFLTYLIPGGLGYIYFEIMKKYVLMITSPLNAGLTYLFCFTLNIGLMGAPIASSISYWMSFILLVFYSKFIAGSECWGGWSRAAFQNSWTFARLAILGILHVGTEWWAFEIVALVAGRLGTLSLAAQSVIMTADQIMNTIPFGIGVATSSRIGNLLGARNAEGAARSAHSSAILAVFFGGVVLAILMGTRHHFAKIFNNDPQVVELVAEIIPFVALFQIADGMNGSCGGTLRGMGRQYLGACFPRLGASRSLDRPVCCTLLCWYFRMGNCGLQ